MKKKLSIIAIILSFFSLFLLGCEKQNESIGQTAGEMTVHYINVGQGDSILIQVNNKNMLIDAGPGKSKDMLLKYLDSLNLKKIDYVIATHPHEDHIGNLDDVINKYEIGAFYSPKVTHTTKAYENMIKALKKKDLKHPHEDHIGNLDDVINKYEIGAFYSPKVTHTTKAYENMIKALKKKDLKINVIKEGTNSIDLGEGTKVSVFSPIKAEYKKGSQQDFNNYSPVMKIEFGKTSFLFTGDAEAEVEKEILKKGYDVSADVLKFGQVMLRQK